MNDDSVSNNANSDDAHEARVQQQRERMLPGGVRPVPVPTPHAPPGSAPLGWQENYPPTVPTP